MDMKEILKSGIEQALQYTINSGDLPAGEYPEIVLEVPPQKEFGDFSTNIAMQSARVARQNPRAIAEALISHMNFDWLERAEVAGAGFINFFLKSDMVYDTLKAILNAGTEYGVQPLRARDTIQVEYVSANPTGPLHVGHGRGAAYGSALVNLLRAAGYNVQSEYYINDAGNQIDNMAISIEYRFQELQGATLVFPPKRNEDGSMPEFDIPEGALVFPENGYRGPDIIETAKENNQKVLLFSSFTKSLDLIEAELRKKDISYYVLTGSTTKIKRHQLVNAFQNDQTTVFLISLKAGGTGLNLTSASTVIHYDPWWNMSAQNQATDRAYRIGQTNNVQVYKLIMKNSIEEKIQKLQEQKQDLSNMFIENNNGSITQMSTADIIDLFK